MGNATSWLAQSLCPEEQALWVAAKSGDLRTLREGLARLTPATRFYSEWRDPVYGYSPLANACSQGHLHCVQALMAYGVDCNARDSQGNTPLHIATFYGKSEVVRLLLENPAVDYFAKTSTKAQTALDIARQTYRTSEGRGLTYIQCVEHIEKVISW
ncbi:Ankyrin repeat domain-containing protein 2B [Phytophthora citrophthora]|uniref:Ankyrin repeat domain-containing protein 2B n=1 Tax=Phytophthora citrophthora TaxID=4793 RepID=A0AAD9G3K6_9STRA|nr:Ankyrin repeat domain-containing protein 2B [Phytophthora citrophthora]